MNKDINAEIRDTINEKLRNCSELLKANFDFLEINDYRYNIVDAIEELGLDADLIEHLIEDYVAQIIKNKATFEAYIDELKSNQNESLELDYTPLRELAHKNLGVARNLRIEDGKKVLEELMREEDLDYLKRCVEALEACAIKLKPKCAYETLKLMSIKNML
jgi:hypothetical protein